MRTSLLVVLALLWAVMQSARAEPFAPGQVLDQRLVADVTASALAFIAPRTLEAVPIPQLTVWGLRGLTTVDPRLMVQPVEGGLRLTGPEGRLIYAAADPQSGDVAGWGQLAAQMTRAAWDASEPVRRTGTGGMIRTFFDELFNHLDPYSRYAGPDEADSERNRLYGRAGVGLVLARRGGAVVVQSVAADSPAAGAAIRPGDVLLSVDGQSVGADPRTGDMLLGGPDGSPVALTLRGREGTRSRELTRALVPPETVRAMRMGDVLVLRVSGFSSTTGARLASELMRGIPGPRPPRGVVLDLRGNRGGPLRQAVAAAETVLTHGLIAVTAGRDPAAAHEFRAHENDPEARDLAAGLPVVVVVDGRSASAAEILAAALADQHRAVVVGSATLGKGLVQTIGRLPDGGALFVTWSRVLAPLGWPIQGLGVMPQVCTSLGEDALGRQLGGLASGQQDLARAIRRSRDARAPLPPAEAVEIRSACPASEGRDSDLTAARTLINAPAAYSAALIGPAPP